MKATNSGLLNYIPNCQIYIPGAGSPIKLRTLPEISDGKQATYNSESIIGRSFPLYTYSHSGDRTISLQLHFFIIEDGDAADNINSLRKIQSAVYPRPGFGGAPYMPPPICTIECGKLLGDQPLCVALQSYNIRFPSEVAWWEGSDGTYCPYKFDIDTSWLVVYLSNDLPYQDRIVRSGR